MRLYFFITPHNFEPYSLKERENSITFDLKSQELQPVLGCPNFFSWSAVADDILTLLAEEGKFFPKLPEVGQDSVLSDISRWTGGRATDQSNSLVTGIAEL